MQPKRYKRTAEVMAMRYTEASKAHLLAWGPVAEIRFHDSHLIIHRDNGIQNLHPGQWLVHSGGDDWRAVDDATFQKDYTPMQDTDHA